ncbi:MAG TPA: putative glycoside hydrolase [Acidimicrobiia bacterium]|nr:putative glycoside hydrolase [Acidimicrobiia bacterium]
MARRTQFRLLVVITLGWLTWAGWTLLEDPQPFTLRVVDDVGDPVVNAVVAAQSRQLGITGTEGLLDVDPSGELIEISAPGHVSATFTITPPDDGLFDVVLKARVLRGKVVDSDGRPIEGATVVAGPARARSDEQGRFAARGAEPGPVVVGRPAWEPVEFEWSGGPGEKEIVMEPIMVKAVHISGEAVEERFETFVEMAASTELNALMVDLKEESGQVLYESEVPEVAEYSADAGLYDLAAVAEVAEQNDLYLIGRLVTFQDPIAARANPEMAVWDEETQAPFTSRDQYFLDPTDPVARAYALDIAAEACALGLDEVQFDYVRFPDARPESVRFDAGVTIDIRAEAIRSFLGEARSLLHPLGCAVAVDVFGFVTTATDDGGIGQRWEDITSAADVVSPMVYPSHYDPGWYGLESPNEHPHVVVDRALADGMARMSSRVVVRPWLQDFGYSAAQVRAQVEVAEKHGLGWMLWNATSEVTVGALEAD